MRGISAAKYITHIAGAAVYGWIAGRHAGSTAAASELKDAEKSPWVAERAALYSSFMEREGGAAWKEANLAVQQIMDSYAAAGPHRLRSETLLAAGLKYMADLRKNSAAEESQAFQRRVDRYRARYAFPDAEKTGAAGEEEAEG